MKKDIEIPVVKDIHIAMVLEWNDEFKTDEWNAYLLNNGSNTIEMVFIVSKGHDGETKTALMRHSMEALDAQSFQKIEFVQNEVLQLNNEFHLTYYVDGTLFEKKFLFPKGSVTEKALAKIPLLDKKGILAQ
ncbi:hypothetical protein [Maribacter sp. HTCC2170]|uniref:hypothetical protein n=1 Tax=Maribacter sp. (strain HTCC2170 / KCCM 42371) TaxID=313603 RepID=UPI00006BD24C|nr:hypothetical protein [Maribacter sp. HTCC2170]EAR02949.1 hypothetical protein FB2170_06660 [Maribacter sp. HTCC2170]